MSDNPQTMTIPREVLLTYRFCAPEDQSVVLSRLHLVLLGTEGKVQVSNGKVSCSGSWLEDQGGVEQQVELDLPLNQAKLLAEMAREAPVVYDHDRQVYTCGSFELSAQGPVQRDFEDIGEVPVALDAPGDPKKVNGQRFPLASVKLVASFMATAKLGGDGFPLVFYGADAPAYVSVERGDMGFTFVLAQQKL